MRKPERELLRTIASMGLGIETKAINSTGNMTLVLKAENGVTKRFVVTVGSGDTRTELNIRQSFKKFARENSLPKPAKGLQGPLQAAMASAVGKVSQQMQDLPKSLSVASLHAEPPRIFPPLEKEAPTMATIIPSTNQPTAEEKKKIVRNVLNHAQMYALCEAVKARTLVQEDTYTSLAEVFTSTLGFKVSPSSVSSAFAVVGKELLPSKVAARRERSQIVAAELIRVQESLGMEVSAELRAVASRKSL